MAPEVLWGEVYDERADIFSFGVVLAEIITRRPPGKNGFLERHPRTKFKMDTDQLRAAAPPDAPPSLIELAVSCLAYEAEYRLTTEDALEWLTSLVEELEEGPASPPPSVILGRSTRPHSGQFAPAANGTPVAAAAPVLSPAGGAGGATDGAAARAE
jgi:LIM domain kinase 1